MGERGEREEGTIVNCDVESVGDSNQGVIEP